MLRTIQIYTAQFLINHFFSLTRFFKIKRFILNQVNGIYIGKNTRIVGPLHFYGKITVGEDNWIGNHFYVEGNGNVVIGNRCDIAPSVICFTGTHEIGNKERRAGKGITKDIQIGDGCWICGGAKILPGVHIGNGSIIAAGAVVANDVPNNVMVGGVPSRILRRLEE